MRIKAYRLRLFAIVIDLIASIILTVHVLFIHERFEEKPGTNKVVEVGSRAALEQGFLIGAVVIYILSFCLLLWAEYIQNGSMEDRLRLIEHHLNLKHPPSAEIYNSEGTKHHGVVT